MPWKACWNNVSQPSKASKGRLSMAKSARLPHSAAARPLRIETEVIG